MGRFDFNSAFFRQQHGGLSLWEAVEIHTIYPALLNSMRNLYGGYVAGQFKVNRRSHPEPWPALESLASVHRRTQNQISQFSQAAYAVGSSFRAVTELGSGSSCGRRSPECRQGRRGQFHVCSFRPAGRVRLGPLWKRTHQYPRGLWAISRSNQSLTYNRQASFPSGCSGLTLFLHIATRIPISAM